MKLEVGKKFSTYEELQTFLSMYEVHEKQKFWKRSSRTLQSSRLRKKFNDKIKYYEIHYSCIYGGEKFRSKGKGIKRVSTNRMNCPANIKLRASSDGETLIIRSFVDIHKHYRLKTGNNVQYEATDNVEQIPQHLVSDCQKVEEKPPSTTKKKSNKLCAKEQPSTSTTTISFYPKKYEPSMDTIETIIIKKENTTTYLPENEYENNKDDVTPFMNDKIKEEPQCSSDNEEGFNESSKVAIKGEPQSQSSRHEDNEELDGNLENHKINKAIQVKVKPKMKTVSVQTEFVCKCAIKSTKRKKETLD